MLFTTVEWTHGEFAVTQKIVTPAKRAFQCEREPGPIFQRLTAAVMCIDMGPG
jgi:hypothetical protein